MTFTGFHITTHRQKFPLKRMRFRWPTIKKNISRKSVLNLYVTTDRLHNLKNARKFFIAKFTPLLCVSLKIKVILSESSHDIVETARYMPRHCSLNLYICWFTNIYLNMQREISQFTIFTKVLTCFLHYALTKMRIQSIQLFVQLSSAILVHCCVMQGSCHSCSNFTQKKYLKICFTTFKG